MEFGESEIILSDESKSTIDSKVLFDILADAEDAPGPRHVDLAAM